MSKSKKSKYDGVNKANAEVRAKSAQWKRVRDSVAGSDAVRACKKDYLPALADMTAKEYNAYALRPVFFEATSRTREAMTGLIFAKPYEFEAPAALSAIVEDIDAAGATLAEFAARMVDEQQETAFGALYVQHSGTGEAGTVARPNGRPFLTYYPAEAVLDWKYGTVGGKRQLTMLRLSETVEIDGETEFEAAHVTQIRVLDLFNGVFRERLFQEKTNGDKYWDLTAEAWPLMNGAPMPYIPARIVAADGKQTPGNAPLSALAELNLSHWRTSADYEHALHFCGLPTPYVTGISGTSVPKGDVFAALDGDTSGQSLRAQYEQAPSIKLGSSQMLTFENPNAKVGFLQLDPSGVKALSDALDRKERQMSVLGARMLAQEKSAVESAEAMSLKRGGETAALTRLAHSVSAAISEALKICAEWLGIGGEVRFALNTEFATFALASQEITALLAAVNAGRISPETFVYNLKRGGRLDPNVSVDDELERIETTAAPANDADPLIDEKAA
jgi:Domain of unknown function (DUF4055)